MMMFVAPEGQTEARVIEKLMQDRGLRGGRDNDKEKDYHIYSPKGKGEIDRHIRSALGESLDQFPTPSKRVGIVVMLDRDEGESIEGIAINKTGAMSNKFRNSGYREDFAKSTVDDYVLRLALYETTIHKLLTEKKETWKVTSQQIINKMTAEIPDLMQSNHIELREAKDYVRFYAAIIQEGLSP